MDTWFNKALTGWYQHNKRDLPWRQERDPYKIWLSEIILQQTQVAQGLSYYIKFVEKFPKVQDLAKASEDEVLKLWQGLGYYSRARNLHSAAKTICAEHKGNFPETFPEIRALKGIGDYTASAIASFAYNLPFAVVDGNVYRVLSRVFGIETPIDGTSGRKQFQELASSLLNPQDPATHNQAIMEFGSQYCRPVNPDCGNCILNKKCSALLHKKVDLLPVKAKKIKIRKRYFNYLVVSDKKGNLIVNRRAQNDIWQGLYEFCLIESTKEISSRTLFDSADFKSVCEPGFNLLHTSKSYKHILSHQHLHTKFYVISTKSSFASGAKKSTINNLSQLAFPRLIEKFLNDCDLKEIL